MKTIGIFLGGVLLVALLFAGYQKFGDWQDAKLVKWKADSARVADESREAGRVAALASITADTVRLRYTVYRDRVLASGTATPRDSATFGSCDAVVSSCKALHAADEAEKASLRTELATARNRPTERPKRLQLYGAGLYDVLNAAPVGRAGSDLRIVGSVLVMGEGEFAIPSAVQCRAGRCGVTTRLLVGVRYVF